MLNALHWIIAAFTILFAAIGVLLAWQFLRSPVAAIDRDLGDLVVLEDSAYTIRHGPGYRLYRDVVLYSAAIDTTRFTLSLPDTVPPGELLPVVPIIGGLEIGRESLAYVPDHGRNALLAYEYPYGPAYWYESFGEVSNPRPDGAA